MDRRTSNFLRFPELVEYDETSPTLLRWKIKVSSKVVVGNPAGCMTNKGGYIRLSGISYPIHRVIYLIVSGNNPGELDVDHIDGNRLNNKPENLRAVPHAVNMRNRSVRSDTEYTGVHYKEIFDKRKNYLYTAWRTEWRGLDGKNYSKMFSTKKYGYAVAKEMAIACRTESLQRLNLQGAGYTDRHLFSTNS